MEKGWGIDLIRDFFAVIDKTVYGLMAIVYQIILDLSEATIISSGSIETIYSRIYALLGVFMLFKVTFSFVNFIINPDAFTDKSKGVQNLIKNVLIVLVLIIITPFAFDKLYEAQAAILDDDLIPRLIFATDETDGHLSDKPFQMSVMCEESATAATNGDYLALMTLRPFYQLSEEASATDLIDPFNHFYCGDGKVKPATYLSSVVYKSTTNTNDMYLVDYSYFLSTLVGIVVCLILISFCFDVAVRSIKLGFLQIIAPIPILSYIDPASSKNGMLSKWLKEIGSTWASLFIRLIAIFFAIFILAELDASIGSSEHGFWVMLFLNVGTLMFAKQLPKLLEELIPGLKLGGMQLDPFKRITNEALGGKQLLGATTAAAGLGVNALAQTASNLYSFNKNKKNLQEAFDKETDADKKAKLGRELASYNLRRGIATTLGGLGGGAYRGLMSGFKTGMSGKINVFGNVASDLKSGNTVRNNRANINKYNREVDYQRSVGNITDEEWKRQRYGFFERNVTERLDRNAGVKNDHGGYGYYDKKIKDLTRDIENLSQTEQAMRNALAQKTNYFSQLLEINKAIASGTSRNDAIQTVARNNGINLTDLANDYLAHERDLKNISYVDSQQKDLKAKKKNYEDMMSAREEVKK